eukprot:2128757-Rhodomonas_salina.1
MAKNVIDMACADTQHHLFHQDFQVCVCAPSFSSSSSSASSATSYLLLLLLSLLLLSLLCRLFLA